MADLSVLTGASITPGDYTVVERGFFESLRAEIVADPELFRRLGGSLRSWNLKVSAPGVEAKTKEKKR